MPVLLGESWGLSTSVSLRPEPFGAMAYDFRTRRLSFLKSRALVAVVERLSDTVTVGEALDAAGVVAEQRPRYLRALEELAASGMITPSTDRSGTASTTRAEQQPAGATA